MVLLAAPAFAIDADTQSVSLASGWGNTTSPSYPAGYGSSWFYQMLYRLDQVSDLGVDLKTGWNRTTYKTGYVGSWYWSVIDAINHVSGGLTSTESGYLASIKTSNDSIVSNTSNLITYIPNLLTISQKSSSIDTTLTSWNTSVTSIATNSSTAVTNLQLISQQVANLETLVSSINLHESAVDTATTSIASDTHILQEFFAGQNERTLHNSGQAATVAANDLYTNNAGGSSAASKVGSMDDFSSSVGDNFSTGVSAGQVFDIMSSGSDGAGGSVFGFFSQAVLDNLDEVQASQRRLRASGGDDVTHYYQEQQDIFNSMVGGYSDDKSSR